MLPLPRIAWIFRLLTTVPTTCALCIMIHLCCLKPSISRAKNVSSNQIHHLFCPSLWQLHCMHMCFLHYQRISKEAKPVLHSNAVLSGLLYRKVFHQMQTWKCCYFPPWHSLKSAADCLYAQNKPQHIIKAIMFPYVRPYPNTIITTINSKRLMRWSIGCTYWVS